MWLILIVVSLLLLGLGLGLWSWLGLGLWLILIIASLDVRLIQVVLLPLLPLLPLLSLLSLVPLLVGMVVMMLVLSVMLLDAVMEGVEPLDDINRASVGSIDGLEDGYEIVELMDPAFLKHLNASVELGHEPEILTLQPSEIDEGLVPGVGVGRDVLVGKIDSVYV